MCVFCGLIQTRYFGKHIMTLLWLLIRAAFLSPRTKSWLLCSSPQIWAVVSPLVPFIGFCIVLSPLSAEVKRGFFEHNCFPYHIAGDMLFRTFMQGVAHAALCGELRLQIATSVTLDVVIIASCLHRWHTKTSVVPSGPNPNCGLPMWLSGSFIVVQWLALLWYY